MDLDTLDLGSTWKYGSADASVRLEISDTKCNNDHLKAIHRWVSSFHRLPRTVDDSTGKKGVNSGQELNKEKKWWRIRKVWAVRRDAHSFFPFQRNMISAPDKVWNGPLTKIERKSFEILSIATKLLISSVSSDLIFFNFFSFFFKTKKIPLPHTSSQLSVGSELGQGRDKEPSISPPPEHGQNR